MSCMRLLLLLGALCALPVQSAELVTQRVEMRELAREYRLDGIVEAVSRTTVSAQTQGQVREILFDVDDFVEKDAVVARIKDTEHRARLAQASAELKAAEARLEQAREEHARISDLYRQKNVSESAMDQAEADLTAAQAALEAASAGLEQAREQLDYTQIRAPYSGIVTHRHVEIGETLAPGQPVMTGISLDQLRVIVDVPQSIIASVRGGGAARVYLDEGEPVESTRITVFPFADPGSNTFKVRLDLPPDLPELFPGMLVKTGFEIGARQELVAPSKAVVRRSELTALYVVDERGQVGLRQVRLGRALKDAVVVLAGLEAGERVALDPIAAGLALRAQREAAAEGVGHE